MRSIRTKILFVVISGLLIMSTTLGCIVLYASNKILARDADKIMKLEAENEAAKINYILDDMEKSILIVSEAAVEQLDSVESLSTLEYLRTYTRNIELLFDNVAGNTDGMIAYYFRYNPDLCLRDAGFFYGMTSQSNELQKLVVSHLSGDRSKIAWWNDPVTAQKPVWIDPHYHRNADFLMVSYVAPIYKDGQLVGVAGMDIQLSLFFNAIKDITPYENGHVHLISNTGEELYHSQALLNDDGVISASAPLDNGMTLVACAYYNDVQSQGNKMLVVMFLVSVGVVALFIIFGVFMSQKIVKPLRRLAAATQKTKPGTQMMELECDLKDEVGQLYRVINESNRQLYEYMSGVQTRVYRDSLTGLKNLTAYSEDVKKLEKRMQENVEPFAVLFCDINNLKIVNDTYGHDHGNDLIVLVSKIIATVFRRSVVYRIGGDEFVVILEKSDFENREALINELDSMCAKEHLEINDVELPISVARGIAIYDQETDLNYDNLFHRADSLMYRHKRETKEQNAKELSSK